MSSRKEKQFIRDRDRAANFVARKTGFKDADERERHDWSAADRYADPPALNANGKGIRAGSRPSKPFVKKEAKASQSSDPLTKYVATEASPPSDELRYDIPTLSNMCPVEGAAALSHTGEGFLNVVEQCYAKMCGVDGRIQRTLPLEVMVHNFNQLYQLHLFNIANESGQAKQWTEEEKQDVSSLNTLLSSRDVLIPAEIYDWLKGLGKFTDKTGYTYQPNIPKSILPRARSAQTPGGDFGKPEAANHNAYEVNISPLVTKRTVEALLDAGGMNAIEYDPLPEALMPENASPTANLLGYRMRLTPLHYETKRFYSQVPEDWNSSSAGSRVGFNSILWTQQHSVLISLEDKMDIRRGMPPTDKGSLAMCGAIVYDANDSGAVLRRCPGYVESAVNLDPGLLSSAVLKTYRRRRTANAPGYCFVGKESLPLEGWDLTINSSYYMDGVFAPTLADGDRALDDRRFKRVITESRMAHLLTEITRLTLKKR